MMKVPFADLKAQYSNIKSDIDNAIAGIIENTSFIGGEPVKRFEQEWASTIGSAHCVSTGNGTDSIEIILAALGIGKYDEVIVPSHSWISTAEAVVTVGAKPVFVDTLDRVYTIDVQKIESKITQHTKAIIPVHLFGMPCDMEPLMDIARKHNLLVIEDCAQSHLAEYKGKKVGTFGQAASFSFYPGKNLGAYGDAGAITTNNEELAILCKRISNHGQLKKHEHLISGRNSRLDTIQAAILSAKLPYLKKWTDLRIEKSNAYRKALDPGLNLQVVNRDYKHVYHLFVIQVDDRLKAQKILTENGIESFVHYPVPMPSMPAFKSSVAYDGDFPANNKYVNNILSIPIFPEISQQQIDYVADVLNSLVR